MKRSYFVVSCIFLLCVGCSSRGFDRGDLRKQIGVAEPVVDEEAIAEALSKKPNLPKSFRLAVYYKENTQTHWRASRWRWQEQDKKIFDKVAKKLKSEGVVSQVIPIVSSVVQGDDLKSIRLAAARHGADAVLVIGGVADVDRYINDLGWTYTLILPTLFMPGSQADSLFIVNATLWDVRNEYLYATAEAEGLHEQTYVAAFGDEDKELIAKAKTSALESLSKEFEKMVITQ
ncbi:MAG: hypothetical protein KDD33_05285 [Bdellovibrionales bacterium]|nr:hypothetical protein [Bdellovibrionales bacterium]